MSEHFEAGRWADFARRLAPNAERAHMEAHLSGCGPCRRTAQVMDRLTNAGRVEAAFDVPAQVVRRAKASYAGRKGEKARASTRLRPRLVYNSLSEPLPAGMRSANRPTRLLYTVLDYAIDLNLTREHGGRAEGPPRLVLVGQIADRRQPAKRLADVPVRLLSGRETAACAVSNHLGEFHLQYDSHSAARLEITVEGGKRIEIPLARFSEWMAP